MARPADDLHSDPLLHSAPSIEGFKVLEPAVLYARVGQGGMGAVYRGRHFGLECDVAVKVLKPDLAQDEQFVLRFEREARLAARIKNDNVVQVLDVRHKNGIHYLVMEFVRGETARERVARKGALAEQEALAIAVGVARGLRAAHDDGIVHRDIKPENVLIGADGAVKLADLGLAKQKRTAAGEQSLTMLSTGVMGTPQYMSPEQWRTADVRPSADVWALGAVLWFLLAGRSAIKSGELLEIAERIRDEDFPDLAAVRKDVRPEVCALVARCTRRDPQQRFADARELLAALRPLVGERDEVVPDAATGTGKARMSTVTPPPRSTLAKIKLQVTGAAADATEAWSGPEPRSEQPTVPRTGAPADGTRSGPRRRGLLAGTAVLAALGLGGYGATAGWFAGAAGAAAPTDRAATERGANEPPAAGTGTPGEDAATRTPRPAEARAALARGNELLPQPGRLDDAIAEYEAALAADGSLLEAKQKLVLALSRKGRQLEASDLDAAYATVQRALDLRPDDAEGKRVAAAVRAALQRRLLAGLSLATPAADAVLPERSVAFAGRMVAPKLKALRAVLLPKGPILDAPFPRERAVDVAVVAGEFEGQFDGAMNGLGFLRLQAEDVYGLVAELPVRPFVVDSQAPTLRIDQPAEGALVPASVVVAGYALDGTLREVTVDGRRVEAAVDGAFRTDVVLRDGAQQVAVVARDALDRVTTVRRALRVDAKAPQLSVQAPAATNVAELPIEGTATDENFDTLTMDGRRVDVRAGGRFVASVRLGEEREYAFVFVATDAVGNEATQTVRVRYDTTAPVLAWGEPAGDTVAPGPVTVAGRVQDVGACDVAVNGASAVVDGARWQATVQVAAGASVRLQVTARDDAGNPAKPLERTLRGEDPVVVPAWADRASDAKDVVVDGRKYPSIVVEQQTGMRLLLIRPGQFRMGSPASEPEREADERQHTRVITKAFWLGETEVTQAQWQKVMGSNPSRFQGADNPVEQVSWEDCQQFFANLNRRGGGGFRLPSEAEWEYACRAGTSTPFSFGPNITPQQVNYDGNGPYAGGSKGQYRERTVPVRSLPPNAWGLYEMHGNVWEWCADSYVENYPQDGADQTPVQGGALRVLRGGSWHRRLVLPRRQPPSGRASLPGRPPRVPRLEDSGLTLYPLSLSPSTLRRVAQCAHAGTRAAQAARPMPQDRQHVRSNHGAAVVSGALRVLRGGSWNNNARNCRAANRNRNEPANRNDNIGFRASSTAFARVGFLR